jgi:predicted nucleotidyltransferase
LSPLRRNRSGARTRPAGAKAAGTQARTGLFPLIRSRLLALLLLSPERGFYLSEAARLAGTTPRVASYNLEALSRMGVLHRSVRGREVVYQANTSCPIFPELRSIMVKTVGLVDQVREALAPLKAIEVAFIYGSFAQGAERAGSDIDLFVVGDVGLAELVPVLQPLEQSLAREITPVTIDVEEFRKRLAQREHFVTAVLKGPKLFVWGDENDLERLGGGGAAEEGGT